MRCIAITCSGKQCKKTSKTDLCWTHSPCEMSECGVCLEETLKCNIKLECSHKFCKECIYKWFLESDTCPTCRAVTSKHIFRAQLWGEQEGYMYRPEVVFYPLSSTIDISASALNYFESVYNVAIMDDEFKNFYEKINNHETLSSIFNELQSLSYTMYPLVKKSLYNPTKIHMFVWPTKWPTKCEALVTITKHFSCLGLCAF